MTRPALENGILGEIEIMTGSTIITHVVALRQHDQDLMKDIEIETVKDTDRPAMMTEAEIRAHAEIGRPTLAVHLAEKL